MTYANPTRGAATRKTSSKPFGFKRELLPSPAKYYKTQGLKLTGGGEWRNAACPFHQDTHPSLRVRLDTGGFRSMVCGACGGDVLAYHRMITGLPFVRAAQDLDAWEVKP